MLRYDVPKLSEERKEDEDTHPGPKYGLFEQVIQPNKNEFRHGVNGIAFLKHRPFNELKYIFHHIQRDFRFVTAFQIIDDRGNTTCAKKARPSGHGRGPHEITPFIVIAWGRMPQPPRLPSELQELLCNLQCISAQKPSVTKYDAKSESFRYRGCEISQKFLNKI